MIGPSSNPPRPALATRRCDRADGTHYHLAFCPWCEVVHQHGETAGQRGAHCVDSGARSPLTGYDLLVVERQHADAKPSPFPGGRVFGSRRFWCSIQLSGGALRKAVVEAIFARKLRGEISSFRLTAPSSKHRAQVAVSSWGAWNSSVDDEIGASGDDLLSLACRLFNLPPGVVVVRVLEEAFGVQLDAPAALAIAAAIDDFYARGAPANRGRRA